LKKKSGLWYEAGGGLRGKFIDINAYIKKRLNISILNFHLKNLEKRTPKET